MRNLVSIRICCLLFSALPLVLPAQNIPDLQSELETAETAEERMSLNYQLGKRLLGQAPSQSIEHSKTAHQIATRIANNSMAARSAYQVYQGYNRQGDVKSEEAWLRNTRKYAKRSGDSDLFIRSVHHLSDLASKEGDYRKAYEIVEEAFVHLESQGNSLSDMEEKYRLQRQALEQQQRQLEAQKKKLQVDVGRLARQSERLSGESSELPQPASVSNQETGDDEELSESPDSSGRLDSLQQERDRMAALAQEATRLAQLNAEKYDQLSKEAIAQEANLQEARAIVAEAQMKSERNKFLLVIGGIAIGFFVILALLSWNRYRKSRQAKKELEIKNRQIEMERERSDELLLNILPAPIAAELKKAGKATAKKFSDTSVLFSDFKNFTRIAEALPPEELVEELDKCFKGFDFIISQYSDIEKIKTVGDSYLCASGLTSERNPPMNLIRASLEMQEFLAEHKQERMRLGKPYFEARIGIHTGPVVAGVVGVNKFAYDIWGDTVNIASRVENEGIPGKVNISESTYHLVKDQFECSYRGKVEAKNKGLLDMYFVERERAMSALPG